MDQTLCGIAILLSFFAVLYFYARRNFDYWEKRGVRCLRPTIFFGNFGDCILLRKSGGQFLKDLYEKSRGQRYFGFYILNKPALIMRDPALIKSILIKDFDSFDDRYLSPRKADILGQVNLFVLKNPYWRILRAQLSPIFTSGKMKKMYLRMLDVGRDLDAHLDSFDSNGEGSVVELKEMCAKYTTDVTGSCVHGIRMNSLVNPEAEFRDCGRKVFNFDLWRGFELLSVFFTPPLTRLFRCNFFSEALESFLRNAIWNSMMARVATGFGTNDLIGTLMELKKSRGKMVVDDDKVFEYDGDNLVAQAAVFFTAGFETSASTMSFAMYELALQPHLQTRLRDEIASALEDCEARLTYETVMQLPYLDMVISETLRKYPPLPFLDRVATSDYKLPGTDLTIEKGTPVYVPIYGTQFDPEYFPDPERFDPERFSDENKRSRPSCVYMPFGEGPHNCIGMRFGLLSTKFGIARVISQYELTPCDRSVIPCRLNPKALLLAPDGGLYLNIRKIKPRGARAKAD